MTVLSDLNRKDYVGDGVTTTPFPFPYYFLSAVDLKVTTVVVATGVETPLTLNTDYTVTGVGDPAGGFISLMAPLPVGTNMTILREPSVVQGADFVANDPLPSETLEKSLDLLTMIVQTLVEKFKRTLLLPVTSTLANLTLPLPEDGKVLGWNLTQLVNKTITGAGSIALPVAIADGGTGEITPAAAFNALKQAASELVTGVARIATQLLTNTGVNDTDYVTPKKLAERTNYTRGFIAGLRLSNNAVDPTNDIDIAAGAARSDDDAFSMALASALTKRLDAAWAVGTNQGMLDTGAVGNATYHIFLIRRPDTGVVDVLASLSPTGPTMPANYTQKRRIGSIIRSGGAIAQFRQYGDVFKTNTMIDRNDTAALASTLLTLSVPTGIVVRPINRVFLSVGSNIDCVIRLGDADVSANTVVARALTLAADGADVINMIIPSIFFTNTSAQIFFSQTNSVGTPSSSSFETIGWIDRRGQDD